MDDIPHPYTGFILNFIWIYIGPVILILGTVGNLLAISVLSHHQSRALSAFMYLSVRSIVDEITLIVGLLRRIIEQTGSGTKIENKNLVLCRMTQYIGNTATYISGWLIVLLTMERCLIIVKPFQTGKISCVHSARRNIFILCATFMIFSCHLFVSLEIRLDDTDKYACLYPTNYSNTFLQLDATFYAYLPFVLISVMNAIIVSQVYKASKSKIRLHGHRSFNSKPQSQNKRITFDQLSSVTMKGTSNSSTSARKTPGYSSINGEATKQLTVMMLVVSLTFLSTTLPIIISLSIAHAVGENSVIWNTYQGIIDSCCQMLMYVNHSMNFYLYCATGKKFRTQLFSMLRSIKRACENSSIFKCIGERCVCGSKNFLTDKSYTNKHLERTEKDSDTRAEKIRANSSAQLESNDSCKPCHSCGSRENTRQNKENTKMNSWLFLRGKWPRNRSKSRSDKPKLKISWKTAAQPTAPEYTNMYNGNSSMNMRLAVTSNNASKANAKPYLIKAEVY
ncbi:hypothetical protein Ciccas_010732 [Cichlidogyrus casuarinus]|uniref:G-protein coupled receptors family 1 profile domain-containing protein n=1 Tax=Cichlidogyrus casuarinus TaxID=1844966 RepID=A0ABD2PT97_9PLAT